MAPVFTILELQRILLQASGDAVAIGALDDEFTMLGYDSLALIETGRRIEREFGVKLDSAVLLDMATPRVLIDAVNSQLSVGGGK